jgi:23S rRNA (guanine745-N1)-methyltransferase
MLVCPVRDCHLPLTREPKRVVCARGHSFDLARSGYVNLLQPQDRKSKQPGDTDAAVAGRRAIHDLGVTRPLLDGIAALAGPAKYDIVLDAGCGDGFYLGTMARETGFDAHGVDITTAAIEIAAKRYPPCEWVVANADRFIPYADASFSLVMSITARMNSGEFRRVLREDGRLLIAIPAPDDLMELRGAGRDRVARTVEEFAGNFKWIEQRRVSTVADLDADAVINLLHSIYRPMQSKQIRAMKVTFSLDLLLFRPLLTSPTPP